MRKWFPDTWADCVYEWRTVRGWRRVVVAARNAAALFRGLMGTLSEGRFLMRNLTHDITHAWRRLRQSAGYTAFSVITLALALTATTSVHAVLHFLAWRSPAVVEPDRLADVAQNTSGRAQANNALSLPDFLDLRAQQRSFSVIAASTRYVAAVMRGEVAELAVGEAVVDDYFTVFGVRPVAGRLLVPTDLEPGATPALVLGESLSRARFGDPAAAVGATLTLGGQPFLIVGVAPSAFSGMSTLLMPASFWVPLEHLRRAVPSMPASVFDPARRGTRVFAVRGRLADGVTRVQAGEDVSLIGQALEASFRSGPEWAGGPDVPRRWSVEPQSQMEMELFSRLATAILIGVVLVLVLACTNLANLGFSRGSARQAEFFVRRALGASRWRLIREQLVESTIVVGLGGLLAAVMVRAALVALHMDIPIARSIMLRMEPQITWGVAAFAGGAAALVILVVGVWPAVRASAVPSTLISAAARSDRPRWRLQRRLIAVQVAGSVALLMVTVSALQTVARATHSPGVDLARLGLVSVNYHLNPRDEARATQARDEILLRVRETPGIESAAVSESLPFGTFPQQGHVAQQETHLTSNKGTHVYVVGGTASIWKTLGMSMTAGPGFTEDDVRQRRPVVVLSELAAKQLFGSIDVVGRQAFFRRSAPGSTTEITAVTVAGVTADADTFTMGSRRAGLAFVPFSHEPRATVVFTARAADPDLALGALRSAIRAVDPELVVVGDGTGWTMLSGPFYFLGALSWLSAALGALTLVLVMTGLYGVLSMIVAQRWREFGIRMALGCAREGLVRLVLREGSRPVIVGLLIGLGLGLAARFGVGAVLPAGLTVVDPFVLVVVPLIIALATLAATWWPARRAARVDPNVALREQ